MNEARAKTKYAFEERWAPALKTDGHVQVSTFFLKNYHQLQPYPLTHGEAMFVIHLMQHKWGADAPFPAYRTLAERMGVSVKTARRFAASLQQKRYLHREYRIGATNLFYLDKLMAALVALKNRGPRQPKKQLPERRRKT
jgi:hypothetical protein